MTNTRSFDKLKRQATKARSFPENTCAASRHVFILADELSKGDYQAMADDPTLCAESMMAVVAELWKLRAEMKATF